MANPPNSMNAIAESSTTVVAYTNDQNRIIEALHNLLEAMLKRNYEASPFGMFTHTPIADAPTASSILEGEVVGYDNLDDTESAYLLKSLIKKLRDLNVVVLMDQSLDNSTPLTLESFNPDPEIQGIIINLFNLLKKITDASESNGINSKDLSGAIAHHFYKKQKWDKMSSDKVTKIMTRQAEKIKTLIDTPPSPYQALIQDGAQPSSTASILGGLNSDLPRHATQDINISEIVIQDDSSQIQPRSFGIRNLAKIIMTPVIALFAAGLTVTLLIAFPPAGVALALGMLIGAGVAAGVVGLGVGFGLGALVDKARNEEHRMAQFRADGFHELNSNRPSTEIGAPRNFRAGALPTVPVAETAKTPESKNTVETPVQSSPGSNL